MKRSIVFFILVVGFLSMVTTMVFANRIEGNPNGRYRVLIATESTPYKNQLINTLIERLNDGNVRIQVVDHQRGGLNGMDPRDFNAVFISNSGVQAMVRPAVMSWLNSVRAHDSNVILHTTQINDWTPPVQVDSVTSASARGNINRLSDDLVQRIRRFF